MNNAVSIKSAPINSIDDLISKERRNMRDFIFDAYDNDAVLIRNSAPPGIGKSHTIVDLMYMHQDDNFVIVIPDHSMSSGEGDLEDMLDKKGISWVHIYGKTQPHRLYNKFCMKDDGEEYYPGCSFEFEIDKMGELPNGVLDQYEFDFENNKALCLHRNQCPYKAQYMSLDKYQVIICVLEHLSMFDDRVVIFDESFEQKLLKTRIMTKEQLDAYNIRLLHEDTKKLGKETYTFYNKIEFPKKINVNSQFSYFLAKYFESVNKINAYKMIGDKDEYCIFGLLIDYLPQKYRRIIFNCATTPKVLMYKITNTEVWADDWKIYKSSVYNVNSLKNPIIKFSYNWGRNFSEKWLDLIIKYLKSFNKSNILIVSKKFAINERFKKEFAEAKFVHYNAGRGFNSADGTDLIIMYGRFGFTPINFEMWKRMGVSAELVKEMEMSEMLQCLHRGRPLLHPKLPIIMMSDNKLFPEVKSVGIRILQLFYKHMAIDLTMSNEEISERIGVDKNRLSAFKQFIEFVRENIY